MNSTELLVEAIWDRNLGNLRLGCQKLQAVADARGVRLPKIDHSNCTEAELEIWFAKSGQIISSRKFASL